jgi:hypothetical protein
VSIPVVSAVGVGAPMRIPTLRDKALQIDGDLAGSIDVEITLNEAGGWYKFGSSITAPGIVQITTLCAAIRIRTTAYTGGAFTATLLGFNARTDV